jgi:putative SbcD/Mre11-related phosphoesterase
VKPKFITDQPAILLDDTLVISDLHIGMEYELYQDGVKIPPQTPKMLEKIMGLIEITGAKKIVLLGDVKHMIVNISDREFFAVPEFLKKLSEQVKVEIVPGNHDGDLKTILPKGVKLHSTKGFAMDNVYLNHGHTWPSPSIKDCDYLIIGHLHPVIEFRDSLGYRSAELAWIRSKVDKKLLSEKYGKMSGKLELIVMPAFNHLMGGMPFNVGEPIVGPILKYVNVGNARAHLLDGTLLGKIKDLRQKILFFDY